MSTTRPPLTRKGLFYVGFGIASLLCIILAIIIWLVAGWVPGAKYDQALSDLNSANEKIENLNTENQALLAESDQLKGKLKATQAEVDSLNQSFSKVKNEVSQFRDKESQAQFVVNRQEMEIKSFAKTLYEIEGLDVRVMKNGILVTGIVPPFRMGSTRIEDDTLIPRLEEIAQAFKEVNSSGRTAFYAAAVGNTDATPVKAWSAHHSNLWLGAKRARSLAEKMKQAGFPDEETLLVSWGSIQAGQQGFDPESRKAELFIMTADALNDIQPQVAEVTGSLPENEKTGE